MLRVAKVEDSATGWRLVHSPADYVCVIEWDQLQQRELLCSACLKQQIFKVYSARYEDLREIMHFFHSFLSFSDINKHK